MCPEEAAGAKKIKEVKRIAKVNITHQEPPPCKARTKTRIKCLGNQRECLERQPIGNNTTDESMPICDPPAPKPCEHEVHERWKHFKKPTDNHVKVPAESTTLPPPPAPKQASNITRPP